MRQLTRRAVILTYVVLTACSWLLVTFTRSITPADLPPTHSQQVIEDILRLIGVLTGAIGLITGPTMLILNWRNDRRAAREFELKIAMLQEQLDEIRQKKSQHQEP